MDVRCAKCGIEYEFDDAKVTAAGVTVKCTNCGHVFKVKREESSTVPPSPSTSFGQVMPVPAGASINPNSTFAKGMDGGEWMVKRVDGQVFRFKELTTLQKWIVERKVGRDDEISKTGKTWKRLGEIAELASFFQVVDAANAALQASVIPVQPAMSAMSAPGAAGGLMVMPNTGVSAAPVGVAGASPSQVPTAIVPQQPHPNMIPPAGASSSLPPRTQGVVGDIHAQATQQHATAPTPAPAQQQPPRDPAPPSPLPPSVPIPGGAGAAAGFQKNVPTERIRRNAPTDPGLDALDDDDPVLQMIKRRRRNAALVVVLVILVAGGVVAAVFWPQLQKQLGLAPAGVAVAAPQIGQAQKAQRGDRRADIEAAREALGTAPPSAATTAWAILLDIALASHDAESARIEDALAGLGVKDAAARSAHANALRESATTALAASYPSINKVRDTPGLPDGHLASAAYNLEKDGLAEQRADLEQARASLAPDARADAAALDAEIAALRALADAHAGLAAGGDAKAALDKLPQTQSDGRLVYAKAALTVTALAQAAKASGKPPAEADVAAARAAVAAVPQPDERTALLTQWLDALAAAPSSSSSDAGQAAAEGGDAGAGKDAAVDDTPPPPSAPVTYEGVMALAERARVNEHSKSAHELFLRAIKLKPGAPRPWLGLGWTALDLGKNAEAVKDFKKALELDDGLGEAEFGLAEALRYSGQKSEAIDAYKTYLKMEPNGKDAGTAKRAIEALQ